MPRKTSDPHPESFFAFACWVMEKREFIKAELPAYFPAHASPEILRRVYGAEFDRLLDWQRDDHAERYAALQRDTRREVHDWLVEAGLDRSQIDEPNPARERLVKVLVGLLAKPPEPDIPANEKRSVRADPNEGWHPQRRHVEEVISVVYVVLGDQHPQRTADILNEGLATKDKAYTLNRHDVRHAVADLGSKLEGCMRWAALGEAGDRVWREQATILFLTAQALRRLWDEARTNSDLAGPTAPMSARAWVLFENGSIARAFKCDDPKLSDRDTRKLAGDLIKLGLKAFDRKHGFTDQEAA